MSDSCESSPVLFAARLARFSGFAFRDEVAGGLAGFRPAEPEARVAFGVFFLVAFFRATFFLFAVFFAAAFLVRVAFFFADSPFELDFV